MTAAGRSFLLLLTLAGGGMAQAAVPMAATVISVSATVIPLCNHTGCSGIPRVVRYRSAAEPPFGLPQAGNARVLTVTY